MRSLGKLFNQNFQTLPLFPNHLQIHFNFNEAQQITKMISNEEQELNRLRRELLKLCPTLEKEIMIMDKEDLEELIAESRVQVQKREPINEKRKNMETKLMELCPGMEEELKLLQDADVEEIYQKCLEQISQPPVPKKNPIEDNGEINIAEMKSALSEKLPHYRNQIKDTADDEIRRMFREAQDDFKAGEKPVTKEKTKEKVPVRDEDSWFPSSSVKSGSSGRLPLGYSEPPPYPFIDSNPKPNPQKKPKKPPQITLPMPQKAFAHSLPMPPKRSNPNPNPYDQDINDFPAAPLPQLKSVAKAEKAKHKCKITFYLDQSDFEDETGEGDRRMNILAKVVESLSVAMNKSWKKSESAKQPEEKTQKPISPKAKQPQVSSPSPSPKNISDSNN